MDGGLCCVLPTPLVPPSTPEPAPPSAGSEEPPDPPEFPSTLRPWSGHGCLSLDRIGLDRLGLTQTIGGLVLGLIALFSSYDHITFAGRSIPLQQQWGIPLIAASVATVFIDAQLATRSRLRAARAEVRAAQDSARIADETTEERDRADQERQRANRERLRANRERNRAAEARERQAQDAERQAEGLERLDQAALLSARVQLDPNPTNRARLQFFLTLMANRDGTEA